MDTKPLNPYFGIEIIDLDVTAPLTPEVATELNTLFDRHRLLLIRNQEIDEETQVRLVSAIAPVVQEGSSGKQFSFVSRKPGDYIAGTSGITWHSDYMFVPHGPIQVVSLCALVMERPEPTRFLNSVKSAQDLPQDLRDTLGLLNVVQIQPWHDTLNVDGTVRYRLSKYCDLPKEQLAMGVYPAITQHPRTGEPVLMVSAQVTSHFEGMTEEESDALFEKIASYQESAENIYDHEWQVGDLIIWDNIALQHSRPHLASTTNRLLRRVAGNPVPVYKIMAGVMPTLPSQQPLTTATS